MAGALATQPWFRRRLGDAEGSGNRSIDRCAAVKPQRPTENAPSLVAAGFLFARLGGGGNVVGGVLLEEAVRLEEEADVGGGHDGIIFGAGNVRVAHRVPEDDVRVGDRPVLLGPAN